MKVAAASTSVPPAVASDEIVDQSATARHYDERDSSTCDDGAMSDLPPVTDNVAASRFEVTVDGHLAELVYERDDQRFVIVHTGVPDELEGRGVGGILVTAAIDDAARRGLTVVPKCPFARVWLKRHPDVAGRVSISRG
jgi:predicted GNAT family acetyltransferase